MSNVALNSNSKSFTLQQVKTILQSQFKNVQFSFLLFFFNLCSDVLSILLKMSVLSFFFFSYAVFNNVQVSSLSFFSFRLFSIVLYVFVFVFIFFLFFFIFFFIINCSFNVPFFQPYIYLSVFTLTR